MDYCIFVMYRIFIEGMDLVSKMKKDVIKL